MRRILFERAVDGTTTEAAASGAADGVPRGVGVESVSGGRTHVAHADCEVVLAEGAIASPWLLTSGCSLVDLYIAVISRWPSRDMEYRNEWLPTKAPRVEKRR